MNSEFWVTEDCTVYGFGYANDPFTNQILPQGKARREFLASVCGRYPFATEAHGHPAFQIDEEWFKKGWGIDPLVIPITKVLNKIPGIRTYSSCQGGTDWSPSIGFVAESLDGIREVEKLLSGSQERKSFRSRVIVSCTGDRDGKLGFHIWFFDTLSLMEFTCDALGVTLKEQVGYQKLDAGTLSWHKITQEQHLEEMARIFPNPVNVEEIEAILSIEDYPKL